ncbi:glycoside hydrolase family 92 protein [Mariniphaga sediminis]|uniref:Glycoside hydrolase family 92 protein n=1 Tax=Mariniphaga sediminis TaxID=1628158 RepID=A0A399D3J9_9BACT|nr:GH92 family glycosyl hydrolase [Mariniphaga sediminis]RIH65788.1 glycoside hydrolase family 92 protein [Mariniphaga sediminis]
MKSLTALIALFFFATQVYAQISEEDLTQYVNPFIGTQEMGHVFPGACVPFGMVQLSPDTDTVPYAVDGQYTGTVYRYCAGYQYNDPTIVGFSHTHFSGTGHSDLGDFLIMPTVGDLKLNPGTAEKPESGYRSRYSHEREKAEPGYYCVQLDDYDIKAEMTTSSHVGFHQYTFPETKDAHIILDMNHGIYNYDGKVLWSYIRVENDTLVTGYRITSGWARTNYLYFAMVFSKPIKNYGGKNFEDLVYKGFWRKFDQENNFPEMAGKNLKAHFDFETQPDEQIKIKFALSAVSTEGALKNLKAEVPHFDFGKVKAEAKNRWQQELSKIKIAASPEKKVTFYTSMYHTCINPIEYMDVDGQYRGLDHAIHKADGFVNYSIFSLWDTYRALHPLLTLIQPKRTSDMINSMLAHYNQSVHHVLPVWSHFGNENWCMIGYHAVPVIADAWMNGIRGFDVNHALDACVSSATYKKYGNLDDYMKFGYVPFDKNVNGSSMTLEYAYDDWTIAQLAKSIGEKDVAGTFETRSKNWKNLFNEKTGFVGAKDSRGNWKTPFDALHTANEGFIEGNAWNYSLYVPHDVSGLIEKMGGNNRFCEHLDSLFTMYLPDKYFAETEDVTREGLIGCYVHGNEPSHHVAYMYNWAGKPWKTQERVNQIVNTMYLNKPDGLCGNDDCGQMSAWYIFSSLGFYPVCPGSGEYVVGSPSVNKAEIQLADGKKIVVTSEKLSAKNIYIQSVILNGKEWNKTFIPIKEIINGGSIQFKMGAKPNKKWGITEESRPFSMKR